MKWDIWHDENTQKAINQLSACSRAFDELKDSIREMLDDVLIASNGDDKSDVLSAWNDGKHRVIEQKKLTQNSIKETLDFMEEPSFEKLDSSKKTNYWDTIWRIQVHKNMLDAQYTYYALLADIEHMEQTIAFLWQNLKIQRNNFLYRIFHGTLVARWLILHKNRIQATRERLFYEIQEILRHIEWAIEHPHFDTMSRSKQQEYYSKWEWHAKSMLEIL